MSRKVEITNRIHQASIDEFISKGIESASMENIAKTAEVSKRTLYKYFPSKEDIFDDIINTLLESFCGMYDFSFEDAQSIHSQVELIIDRKVNLITNPEYLKISKLVLGELLKSRPLKEEQLEQFYESEQKFVIWIDNAKMQNKIISTLDSKLIAKQFHSLIKGQLFYPVLFGFDSISNDDIQAAKTSTLNFFLNSFC